MTGSVIIVQIKIGKSFSRFDPFAGCFDEKAMVSWPFLQLVADKSKDLMSFLFCSRIS